VPTLGRGDFKSAPNNTLSEKGEKFFSRGFELVGALAQFSWREQP